MNRQEFVDQVIQLLEHRPTLELDISDQARQAYEALEYDFPLITVEMIDSIIHKLREDPLNFSISSRVVEGILYCNGRKDNSKAINNSLGILNALAFVKFSNKLIRLDLAQQQSILQSYYTIEKKETYSFEQKQDDIYMAPLVNEVVYALEGDTDEFVYESAEILTFKKNQLDIDLEKEKIMINQQSREEDIEKKIVSLFNTISYSLICSISSDQWEELNLTKEILEIISYLINCDRHIFQQQCSRFLILLCDRTHDYPSLCPTICDSFFSFFCFSIMERKYKEDINETIVRCLKRLINSRVSTCIEIVRNCIKTKLSKFALLISQSISFLEEKKNSDNKQQIAIKSILIVVELLKSYIQPYSHKLAFLSAIEDLRDNGILRSLFQILMSLENYKEKQLEQWKSVVQLVSICSITSTKDCFYLFKIPQIVLILKAENFQRQFPSESITILLSFSLLQEESQKENYLLVEAFDTIFSSLKCSLAKLKLAISIFNELLSYQERWQSWKNANLLLLMVKSARKFAPIETEDNKAKRNSLLNQIHNLSKQFQCDENAKIA